MVSKPITILESNGAKLTKHTIDIEERSVVENAIAEIQGKLEICPPIESFADENVTYGYFYSSLVAKSINPTSSIKALLVVVNDHFGADFNGVLVNYYPDGHHYISDYSDSEAGLDAKVGVVVLSVGATCTMHFKRTKSPPEMTAHFRDGCFKVSLADGSMIAMQGPKFQSSYTHGIPKEPTVSEPRWSFTFRRHTGNNESLMNAAANKTLARIADKIAAREAEEAPVAKRAKLELVVL